MVLIKKSASVIENEYKRIFIRFLKELKLVQYWYKYINTDRYLEYAKSYTRGLHENRTTVWYDRHTCMKILGICDFSSYLKERGVGGGVSDTYNLYAAFLGIFWEEEYYKWAIEFSIERLPSEQANWVRRFSMRNAELIDNWIKLKNALG